MKFLKTIIPSLLFVALIISCTPQKKEIKSTTSDQINWLTNLETAMKTASSEEKSIFVDFTGSDWCGWCFKLNDEVFSQPEFIQYAQNNLVMLEIDFPRDIPQSDEIKAYNRNLLDKYKIQGFPTILLLDAQGNEINRTGYQPGGAVKYAEHISELLGK